MAIPLPLIAGIFTALAITKGLGAVERESRKARARTDPFFEEKKAVIRKLLQMSPYLPDVSYSDFARMLGIEEKKEKSSSKTEKKEEEKPENLLRNLNILGLRTLGLTTIHPLNSLISGLLIDELSKEIKNTKKGG
jgi:hypothetical protein